MAMLQAIQQIDTPVLDMPATQQQMTDATVDTTAAYNAGAGQAITNMGKPTPPLPNMNPNLGGL
jgi:hypothetical protein